MAVSHQLQCAGHVFAHDGPHSPLRHCWHVPSPEHNWQPAPHDCVQFGPPNPATHDVQAPNCEQ